MDTMVTSQDISNNGVVERSETRPGRTEIPEILVNWSETRGGALTDINTWGQEVLVKSWGKSRFSEQFPHRFSIIKMYQISTTGCRLSHLLKVYAP